MFKNNIKSNIRSFRYDDKVAEVLEGFEGNSLNDKFNNLVHFCFSVVEERQKQLDCINSEIERKRNLSLELSGKLTDIDMLIRDLNNIKRYGEIAVKRAKQISESDV